MQKFRSPRSTGGSHNEDDSQMSGTMLAMGKDDRDHRNDQQQVIEEAPARRETDGTHDESTHSGLNDPSKATGRGLVVLRQHKIIKKSQRKRHDPHNTTAFARGGEVEFKKQFQKYQQSHFHQRHQSVNVRSKKPRQFTELPKIDDPAATRRQQFLLTKHSQSGLRSSLKSAGASQASEKEAEQRRQERELEQKLKQEQVWRQNFEKRAPVNHLRRNKMSVMTEPARDEEQQNEERPPSGLRSQLKAISPRRRTSVLSSRSTPFVLSPVVAAADRIVANRDVKPVITLPETDEPKYDVLEPPRPPLSLVQRIEQYKVKLEKEKVKIKNIIGDNPYVVRNYVKAEELDNRLLPKKLLAEKVKKFNNDEEFVEDFLKESKKKEDLKLQQRGNKRSAAANSLTAQLKVGLRNMLANQVATEQNSPLGKILQRLEKKPQERSETPERRQDTNESKTEESGKRKQEKSKSKAAALKDRLANLIKDKQKEAENSQQTLKKKLAAESLKARLAEALRVTIDKKVKAVKFDQEEEQLKQEIKSKNEKILDKLRKKPNAKISSKEVSEDGSRPESAAEEEATTAVAPLAPRDAAQAAIFGDEFEKTLAQAKSLAKVSTATRATKKTITQSASKVLTTQPSADRTGFFGLNRQDNSIQQLFPSDSFGAHLRDESLKKLPKHARNMTSVNSVQQLNFVPGGKQPSQAMLKIEASQPSLFQSNSIRRLTEGDSHVPEKLKRQFSPSQAEIRKAVASPYVSQGSIKPTGQQSHPVLTLQQYDSAEQPVTPHSMDERTMQNTELKATKFLPRRASLYGGERKVKNPQLHDLSSPRAYDEEPKSDYVPLQKILSAKFPTDFVPGKITDGAAANSDVMKKIRDIVNQSGKLNKTNLSMIEITDRLRSRVKLDRSALQVNRQSDMYAYMPYFEKAFRERKYEVEDLYIKRAATKILPQSLVQHTRYVFEDIVTNQDDQTLHDTMPRQTTVSSFKFELAGGDRRATLTKFDQQAHGQANATASGPSFGKVTSVQLLVPADGNLLRADRSLASFSQQSGIPPGAGLLRPVLSPISEADGDPTQTSLNLPSYGAHASPSSTMRLRTEDVIHVTLEADTMKQLIKLSQDIISADMFEAEIEKKSSALKGSGSLTSADGGKNGTKASIHLSINGSQFRDKDSKVKTLANITEADEVNQKIGISDLPMPFIKGAQSTDMRQVDLDFAGMLGSGSAEDDYGAEGSNRRRHFLVTGMGDKEVANAHLTGHFNDPQLRATSQGIDQLTFLEQTQRSAFENALNDKPTYSKTFLMQGGLSTEGAIGKGVISDKVAEVNVKISEESTYYQKELEEFADIPEDDLTAAQLQMYHIIKKKAVQNQHFTDLYKKMRIQDQRLRVAGRIESYVKEKQEIARMQREPRKVFKVPRPVLKPPISERIKAIQKKHSLLISTEESLPSYQESSLNELLERVMVGIELEFESIEKNNGEKKDQIGEIYLNLVNYYVVGTTEPIIQSKIRQLLLGTELEKISETARVIVNLEDNARQYVKSQIQEKFVKTLLDYPNQQPEVLKKYERFVIAAKHREQISSQFEQKHTIVLIKSNSSANVSLYKEDSGEGTKELNSPRGDVVVRTVRMQQKLEKNHKDDDEDVVRIPSILESPSVPNIGIEEVPEQRSELEADGQKSHITSVERMDARGYDSPPPRVNSGMISPNDLSYQSRTQAERGQLGSKTKQQNVQTGRQSRVSLGLSQRQSEGSMRAGADLAAELNYNGPTEDNKGTTENTNTLEDHENGKNEAQIQSQQFQTKAEPPVVRIDDQINDYHPLKLQKMEESKFAANLDKSYKSSTD